MSDVFAEGGAMSEGVKYPMLHVMIRGSMFECEQVRDARVELAAAERSALDYARIDALRLAAEKEVDVLAGELEVARKRIGELEIALRLLLTGMRECNALIATDCRCTLHVHVSAAKQVLDRGQS